MKATGNEGRYAEPAWPDGHLLYCSRMTLFLLMLVSVLISLLITLGGLRAYADFWRSLGLNGLFVTWVGLFSLFFLCLLSRSRSGLPTVSLFAMPLVVVPIVVAAFSFLVMAFADFVDLGGLLVQTEPALFLIRNVAIAVIVALAFARYLALHEQWKRQIQAETAMQLNALQSRIRPHFLFNTLNTISSLIHDRPDQAEQATMDLADLLRTGLKDEPTHALSDELDLIRGYLRIEQLRLGDRLNIEWDISDEVPLAQQLPSLLLQPLVENAVIHGISHRAQGGTLGIEGRRIRFGRIRFTVTNPLADPDSRPAGGNQSALENIRQRLALAFEERYGLKTRVKDGHFKAELTIPVT